jgi:hypothetical protein
MPGYKNLIIKHLKNHHARHYSKKEAENPILGSKSAYL